ncbi:hypothetical protein I4U23_012792 [Adineta vaga]|nr:hypothetical protein I4U23_012792 [Adineta vaga]
MSERDPPFELSAKNLQAKKSRSKPTKKFLKIQTTKPKNSVKLQPTKIPDHFTWALVLTISCFFVIGPCWALYKTFELRRLITQKDFEAAHRLSNRISSTLLISTIIGVFAWVCFLFASVGLLLTGVLLKNNFI